MKSLVSRTLLSLGVLLSSFCPAWAETPRRAADPLAAGFRSPPDQARPTTYWLWLNGYVNRDHVARELQALYDAGFRGVCIFDMGGRGDPAGLPPAGPAFLDDDSVADLDHAIRVAGRLGMEVQLSVASSWDMGGAWVEPRHASMGLFSSRVAVKGPGEFDEVLPVPAVPARAPRAADGSLAFFRDAAVLAVPADRRRPGHDFVFRLDPPETQTLSHAVLYNTPSDDPPGHGPLQLFTKDFSIAVSTSGPADGEFREVLRAALEPHTAPQRFALPPVAARWARLRILSGHNERFDRVQLGEFELFNTSGLNVAASHVADRTRDGAELIGYGSALGHDGNWTADAIHDGRQSGPRGSWSSAGPPPLVIHSRDAVIDLTERLDADGRLRWQVPPGRWEIQRFSCANTGELLKVPSPQSNGLATDHFSGEATRVFLEHLIGRLQNALGDLGQTALEHLYLASYEVRGAIWTPDMLDQFAAYRGYDMRPFLPALSGSLVVDDETTARFVYDYRKTLGELLVEAYYRAAVEAAQAAGVGIESEAGGPGPPIHQVPVDALQALGAIDSIRGEFWPRRPLADKLWVVKETACAGHIYGKPRIRMEAFTSMHHWQDGPIDLKPSADRAFCEGANQFVWHTSSHQPPEAGKPGWVYGAGTHITPNLIWWPYAAAFNDYLARCSSLLQQGLFVADACFYYGDQGYNFVPPRHTNPLAEQGYDYDVTNREVILQRMSVRDGRLVLPDGMSYALLVLPDREEIDLEVLQRVEQFVRDGAVVLGRKPSKATGLAGYPERDGQVRQIADRLWGDADGRTVFEHRLGHGRVLWGLEPRAVLANMGLAPDFRYAGTTAETAWDFIHRRTDDADIYFVRNRGAVWAEGEATFRVRGRVPEFWDPANGQLTPQFVYRVTDDGLNVPLRLAPHGSLFVVFRESPAALPPLTLTAHPEEAGDAGAPAPGMGGAEVVGWDGRNARLLVSQPGRYRLDAAEHRVGDVHVEHLPGPRELAGAWQVGFRDPFGQTCEAEFEQLTSWAAHPDETIRYFSGIGSYRRRFEVPADWLDDNRRVRLDLGRLWAVGEVWVNGRSLGVLWKPPYVIDVTEAVQAGENQLEVKVANTWSNRLVGDARLPPDQRQTRTNVTHNNGVAWRETPLLDSGLFGPVRISVAEIVSVSDGNPRPMSAHGAASSFPLVKRSGEG